MPRIDFKHDAVLSEIANLIWGHMQFPQNTDNAFELFVKLYLLDSGVRTTPNLTKIELPASWLKALVDGPSLRELEKGGSVRNREGVSAGALLWSAFLYCQQPGKVISLNKAIELVTRQADRGSLAILGIKPYANKGELHRAWQAMRNVAHLWAGFFVVQVKINEGMRAPSPESLQLAMGLAQALANWGATCMVRDRSSRTVPLLDPLQLWHLPDFILPIELQKVSEDKLPSFVTEPIGKR